MGYLRVAIKTLALPESRREWKSFVGLCRHCQWIFKQFRLFFLFVVVVTRNDFSFGPSLEIHLWLFRVYFTLSLVITMVMLQVCMSRENSFIGKGTIVGSLTANIPSEPPTSETFNIVQSNVEKEIPCNFIATGKKMFWHYNNLMAHIWKMKPFCA